MGDNIENTYTLFVVPRIYSCKGGDDNTIYRFINNHYIHSDIYYVPNWLLAIIDEDKKKALEQFIDKDHEYIFENGAEVGLLGFNHNLKELVINWEDYITPPDKPFSVTNVYSCAM